MTAFTGAAERSLEAAFGAHDLGLAPAAVAAVFDRDGVVAWKAAGAPSGPASTADRGTVFRVASMSKSFLAAAALSLRDEGLLDFDAPLDACVPGVRLLLDGEERRVTIRQLLTNCSGLPEDNAWGDRRLGDSRQAIAGLGRAGLRLTAEPGETYQYSNLGMSFVGRAVEAVTGETVEAVVAERLLRPLGLDRTRYVAQEYGAGSALALGYRTFDDGRSFQEEPYVGHGALACIGGLFSTVDDIATWAAFLASGFSAEPLRPEVLAAATRREMQRIHTPFGIGEARPHRDLEAIGYGVGLTVEHDRRFGRIVQHSGSLPGFCSHMRWHRASGIGAVVFANSEGLGAESLAARVLSEVLAGHEASPPLETVWPETAAAAERVDAALRAGLPVERIADVLAENVLQDEPAAVRRRRLGEALERTGPVRVEQAPLSGRAVSSADPAELRWAVECERGRLVCDVRLIGLHAPLVQQLAVAVEDPRG